VCRYEKEQEERIKKWEQQTGKKAHDHKHRSNCGCGYADPEEVKRLAEERKQNPEPPLHEKNIKKLKAVDAAREDGNKFFKEGKYNEAYALYHRGILIIQGTYGLNEEDQAKIDQAELAFELNMAACKLHLKDWTEAINHCNLALQQDAKSEKAFYRMGQAYIGMAEYEKAEEKFNKVLEINSKNRAARTELQQIRKLKEQEKAKDKIYRESLSKKLKNVTITDAGTDGTRTASS